MCVGNVCVCGSMCMCVYACVDMCVCDSMCVLCVYVCVDMCVYEQLMNHVSLKKIGLDYVKSLQDTFRPIPCMQIIRCNV